MSGRFLPLPSHLHTSVYIWSCLSPGGSRGISDRPAPAERRDLSVHLQMRRFPAPSAARLWPRAVSPTGFPLQGRHRPLPQTGASASLDARYPGPMFLRMQQIEMRRACHSSFPAPAGPPRRSASGFLPALRAVRIVPLCGRSSRIRISRSGRSRQIIVSDALSLLRAVRDVSVFRAAAGRGKPG